MTANVFIYRSHHLTDTTFFYLTGITYLKGLSHPLTVSELFYFTVMFLFVVHGLGGI